MNRRELMKLIAAATGTAFVGSDAFAYEVIPPVSLGETGFTEADVEFLNEVAEIILPRTDTPGAKDANVGQIMVVIVNDCYGPAERKVFIEGMTKLRGEGRGAFLALSPKKRQALLTDLDKEAREYNQKAELHRVASSRPGARSADSATDPVPHYFTLIKQLTLFGFFTSETGATKALRYVPIPGSYNGDLPYKKGDRAWAT